MYFPLTCLDLFVLSLVISVIENEPMTQKVQLHSVRINIS